MKIIELGKAKNIKGKAGNLNQLYFDFNIARGFILTNEYFLEFLKINHISLKKDISSIRNKIIEGIIPNETELLNYFTNHNYHNVIVRSSASIEDGNNYSFAGQFDSFTNTSIDTLILNIKKCWASKFSDNVKSYLAKYKQTNDFSFDILIQEMIVSDISGIAFSINPSNQKNETLIEITNLQCEDLVNGITKPHVYHITNEIYDDHFITKEKLTTIHQNVQRLKNIFKKNIEIEFGFKDNKFYLFQVRPITSIYFSLNNYINTEMWCCFKNNNWTLFNRSLWILGATKYKNKRIHNEITEDITIYYPHNEKQLRGFNGNQPPLDNVTIHHHTTQDINNYIQEYNIIVDQIKELSLIIKNNIENNQFHLFQTNLKRIIIYNAVINAHEYIIGALGQTLHNQLDNDTIKNIEQWRNSEDNSYFPIYDDIFNYIVDYFHIDIDSQLLKMYTHVEELLNLCDKKIKVSTLLMRIKYREKNGFVLLNLHHRKFHNKVVTNMLTFQTVKQRFDELQNNILRDNKYDGIKGCSTFKNGKIITGECVVLNNITPNIDLKNKIVICEVTTAKDITYLSNIKALIVNHGGILCHSAIFSREFHIPCLIGCEVATQYFHTGDIVSFDVDNEIVQKTNA